jgi:primosomal protein N' (replication factor Y)
VTSPHQCIVAVAVCCPLRQLFDYQWNAPQAPQPGALVWVPFGNRRLPGVVVELRDNSPQALKPISSCDLELQLQQPLLQLLRWCWRYYHHPPGEVIAAALPTCIRQAKALPAETDQLYALSAAGSNINSTALRNKPAQQALWMLLQQAPQSREQLDQQLPNWRRSWRLLCAADLVERRSSPAPPIASGLGFAQAQEWQANAEQQQALAVLCGAQAAAGYQCVLLDGVTGSGKTLLYIETIKRLLQQGGQALLLVPEIGLVQQLREQLQQFLGCEVAVYHSGLTDVQRARCWLQVKTGRQRIVIGTRSSVFLPFSDLRVLLVDEEHDHAYKQFEGFPYHARDVAIKRAYELNIPIVLGSATPSLESLHNVSQRRFRQVQLKNRYGSGTQPHWQLLDQREHIRDPGAGTLLHPRAAAAIHSALAADQQVLVFLNRRGYAPLLQCPACGWSADCPRCAVDERHLHMNWHRSQRRLICHHCSHEQPQPRICPACGEPDIAAIGAGTEKLEDQLQQTFAEYPVHRIDSDNMSRRDAMLDLREQVLNGQPCILAGTQMISKGHHFPGISLVLVLDADQALFSADFRATERLAQQLIQVGGRCGRGSSEGRILVQTHQPEHALLGELTQRGYHAVAASLLEERRLMQLPPWTYQAVLKVESARRDQIKGFLAEAAGLAASMPQVQQHQVQIMGPIPAMLERKAGRFRYQLWLQSARRDVLQAFMQDWIAQVDVLKSGRQLRWRPDVDPLEM